MTTANTSSLEATDMQPTAAATDAAAWQRAALLARLRTPARVRRHLADGLEPPTEEEIAAARVALTTRGLIPWIPWNPVAAPVLLVAGAPPPGPGVAVVGTRASDPYGLACSARVAEDAVRLGRAVVSGGAEGCDAAAHAAAVRAGGATVVVLPCGHDRPYPAVNRPLFQSVIAAGGAVLSPWWPDTPPARHRFLARNAVIAALSHVTVVTRAGRRSGALSTARAAQRLGLTVLAVPGDVGQGLGEGGNTLLAQGALALTGCTDLGRALGLETRGVWPVGHAGSPDPWSGGALDRPSTLLAPAAGAAPDVQLVLDTLRGAGVSDLEGVAVQTGLAPACLAAALLDAEVYGWLERLPAQRFRVAPGAPVGTSRTQDGGVNPPAVTGGLKSELKTKP